MVIILSRLKGRPTGQSLLDRIMVAAGIIVSIVVGIAAAMVLGGGVGGVIAYGLMRLA